MTRKEYLQQWKANRKAAGCCFDCPTVLENGQTRCARCAKKHRQVERKQRTGVVDEAFQAQLVKQSHKCAICSKRLREGKGGMVADHCHKTGAFRGVLCGKCNRGLGFFEDNLSALSGAFEYLLVSIS